MAEIAVGTSTPDGVHGSSSSSSSRKPTTRQQIFIGGLQKSGGDLLYDILARHPSIAGFVSDNNNNGRLVDILHNNEQVHDHSQNNPDHHNVKKEQGMSPETRLHGYTITPLDCQGQLRQNVYPPDAFHGGPGCWAFDPSSHMTEESFLATAANATTILEQWAPHRDCTSSPDSTLWEVEYSSANMLKTRFLKTLFPESHHILVIRHPLACAYAIEKELQMTSTTSSRSLADLVRHWLHAHLIWRQDCQNLDDGCFQVVFYEDLVQDPQKAVENILGFGKLDRRGDWTAIVPFSDRSGLRVSP
jgi:Sulfotransferase family